MFGETGALDNGAITRTQQRLFRTIQAVKHMQPRPALALFGGDVVHNGARGAAAVTMTRWALLLSLRKHRLMISLLSRCCTPPPPRHSCPPAATLLPRAPPAGLEFLETLGGFTPMALSRLWAEPASGYRVAAALLSALPMPKLYVW